MRVISPKWNRKDEHRLYMDINPAELRVHMLSIDHARSLRLAVEDTVESPVTFSPNRALYRRKQ